MADTYKTLTWDAPGERKYETGVKKVVLYPMKDNGTYGSANDPTGVAWNGVTAITESPSGAEASPLYADDTKYLSLRSAETLGATIEAYMYPDEFMACDGTAELAEGVYLGQQARNAFGLSYVTTLGNDVKNNDYSYKIHILYGATASPSEKGYQTINDSPEAITFSWELETTPVDMGNGFKPLSSITIDVSKLTTPEQKANLVKLENALYGTTTSGAYLPLPSEIATMFGKEAA